MGTRNLICVSEGDELKVAQYCQWDGYLEGQGQDIVKFLTSHDLNIFKEKLDKYTKLVSMEEAWKFVPEKLKGKTSFNLMGYAELNEAAPHLVQDTGAKILDMIYKLDYEIQLADARTFAADSLFCEWAYVVNLGNNTLEIYEGFNQSPVPEGERFASLPLSKNESEHYSKYYQVKLYKVLPFEGLKESYKNLIAEYAKECERENS